MLYGGRSVFFGLDVFAMKLCSMQNIAFYLTAALHCTALAFTDGLHCTVVLHYCINNYGIA